MNRKRTRLEVIRDILSVLSRGKEVKITHLIYKSNLSNNSIKPYMQELMQNGLIEEINKKGRRFYVITNKGREFLTEFEKIKVFSEAYGL